MPKEELLIAEKEGKREREQKMMMMMMAGGRAGDTKIDGGWVDGWMGGWVSGPESALAWEKLWRDMGDKLMLSESGPRQQSVRGMTRVSA